MQKLTITEQDKQALIEKFTNYVNNTKFTDTRVNFSADLNNDLKLQNIPRPTVFISGTAYLKMLMYVTSTNVEIAWHGVVERNQEKNYYYIKDVFLYPQIIRAATVSTDQKEYQDWLINIEDDEVANNIRFQGHSHVNMGVTPSGVDLDMYNDFAQALPKNDYYIFMILNKRGETTCLIYDLAKDVIFNTEDIDIKILTNKSNDLAADILAEKTKYCTEQSYAFSNLSRDYYYPNYEHPSTQKLSQEEFADYVDTQYHKSNYNKADYNETDKLFDDIDNKYSKKFKKHKKRSQHYAYGEPLA